MNYFFNILKVDGECKGIVDHFETRPSQEACLDLCQISLGCRWFTYHQQASACLLFQECRSLIPCSDCVSGERRCDVTTSTTAGTDATTGTDATAGTDITTGSDATADPYTTTGIDTTISGDTTTAENTTTTTTVTTTTVSGPSTTTEDPSSKTLFFLL